ncbi:hypothetical protein Tco_0295607 [Tanacetum coccineum]
MDIKKGGESGPLKRQESGLKRKSYASFTKTVAFDLLRDALSAIFGLSELKMIRRTLRGSCCHASARMDDTINDNESSDDDNDDDDVEKDEEDERRRSI